MRDNGQMEKKMVLESIIMVKVHIMKEIGQGTKNKEKEFSNLCKENTMGNGWLI